MFKRERSVCEGKREEVEYLLQPHSEVSLTRISYVAALESRIEKLEKKLALAKSRKSSVTMTGTNTVTPSETALLPGSQPSGRAASRREAADMEELVSDFGYMCVSPVDFSNSNRALT